MDRFEASLLREKFIISEAPPGEISDNDVIAMSNRIVLSLIDDSGELVEEFVVRAHTMHMCLRMAAKITQDFDESGSLLKREKDLFKWELVYRAISKDFEAEWNPEQWIAAYSNGKLIYEGGTGERHGFLDIIEQCDARNKDNYERSLVVAEEAFQKAGKKVYIEHNANVAAVFSLENDQGKCGIILRGPDKTTTFNFKAKPNRAERHLKPAHLLNVAAAFLEGIQLAFYIGMTNIKLHYEIVRKYSHDEKHKIEGGKKLGQLNDAITRFEKLYDVQYFPDRPDISKFIDDAEEFAQIALAEQIEKKIAESDGTKWMA